MNASIQPIAHSNIPLDSTTSLESRFILAQVSDQTLAIPAAWVAEILRVEKNKILNLPFYDDLILGITHHNGRVLPLLATSVLLGQHQDNLRDMSIVIRLGSVAQEVVEVGLVVNRVICSVIQSELPAAAVVFNLQMLQLNLWQPLNN